MGVYTAATIPTTVVESLLETYWDVQGGSVPAPTVIVPNDLVTPIRYDLRVADYVVVKHASPAEVEEPIGTWIYANRTYRILLEMSTNANRQRLWDIKDEIRRIVHDKRHSLTGFQRIQYRSFTEQMDEQQRIWRGNIQLELLSSAVLMDTENT